jgi:UDP:flavonoid glycosyltransferase YjiC (YdhE family)
LANIVFAILPETGHINASLKFAKGLKSRGHQVSHLGLADFAPYIRSQGLNFVSMFEDLYPQGYLAKQAAQLSNLRNLNIFQSLLMASTPDGSPASLERMLVIEVSKAIEKTNADLFIVDALLPDIALLIRRTNVACVLLHTILFDNLEDGTDFYAPLFGMPELILCPQEFDFPDRPRGKRRLHYLEASVDLQRKEAPFAWDKLDDRLLVYCSLGSQSHLYKESRLFFQTAIDAMAGRPDWQMLLSVGNHLKHDDFESIPPNVLLVNSVPQIDVLKRAAVMLTHGGINTVKECIFLGVPMIVFPVSSDQPMNAARIEYHGLGLRGGFNKLSVELIQSLIGKIEQNPSFKKRVEAMRQTFREIEDAEPSLDFVETLLQSRTAHPASDIPPAYGVETPANDY